MTNSSPRPRLVLEDPRALLEAYSALRPAAPDDPASVREALARIVPGLSLRLRGVRKTRTYTAWLWEGNDGQAYFSKRFANGKTSAWKAGATIERALKRNPKMERFQ